MFQLTALTICNDLVVEYRTRNRDVAGSTRTRSTASNLEQVSNLLCAQTNSVSYPQRDGKWVVAHLLWATWWRPRLIGAIVCLLAAPWSNCPLARAMDGHIMSCGTWFTPISYHFRDCKALPVTSLTHVSSAITSVQTFTFTFFWQRL